MAPVIKRSVLIVAHGSPSDPAPQEVAVAKLAARFQGLAPEMHIVGATLAAEGALARAVQRLENPIVCPWFMSDGWFVSTNMPNRLRAAGLEHWDITPPLGLMPGIGKLMAEKLRSQLRSEAMEAGDTRLILAAHGSPSSDRPRLATEAAARAIAEHLSFKSIDPCYVDESPAIRDIARLSGSALVLPFFAARAGHVLSDLPQELAAADFTGPVLEPVGLWQETPAVALRAIENTAIKEPS